MQEIKKIAIIGAGAIGAYFASKFFDTPGISTVLIAKGNRLDRLKNEGLVVNGKSYAIPTSHPAEITSPVDLVIVALKNSHLAKGVQGLDKLVGELTSFISIMNGLDSEDYIGSIYGIEKVLYAVYVAIDAQRQGNNIIYTNSGKLYFGEANNTQLSQRILSIQEVLKRAGIDSETPEDMIRMLWWKFMVNVGMNQSSAVMRASYGVLQTSTEAKILMEMLMQEAIELSNVFGVNLTSQDIEEWYKCIGSLSPYGKTSMLQDIEAGRKTEIDIFGKKIIELGRIHEIPTPVNHAIVQIIQVLEHYGK